MAHARLTLEQGVQYLGGAAPSTTITPAQLLAELDRVAPTIVSEVEGLDPAAWRGNGARLDRVITCLVELLKLVPTGADRSWLDGELARDRALDRRRQADAPRQCAEHQFALEPRDGLADAAMDARAESHVAARPTLDVEAVGVRVLALVPVG